MTLGLSLAIGLTLGGVVALSVTLLLIDVLLAQRAWSRLGLSFVVFPWELASNDRSNIAERRSRLKPLLSEPVNYRFVETRSGMRQLYPLSEQEAAAQLATFRWQSGGDLRLKLARVADTVSILSAMADTDTEFSRPFPLARQIALRLVRIPLLVRLRTGLKRWTPCVVIQTTAESYLGQALRELSDWLGVSIAFQPVSMGVQTGRCAAGGRVGQIGGEILWGEERYGLTAAHTTGDRCMSRVFGTQLDPITYGPDVALVSLRSTCFEPAEAVRGVRPVSLDEAKLLGRRVVFMRPSGRSGRVDSLSIFVSYGDRIHEFPHLHIVRDARTFLGIRTPGATVFSRQGDSGSWVMAGPQQWVGVLVGGDALRRVSYAALAGPIVTYLEWAQVPRSGTVCAVRLQQGEAP